MKEVESQAAERTKRQREATALSQEALENKRLKFDKTNSNAAASTTIQCGDLRRYLGIPVAPPALPSAAPLAPVTRCKKCNSVSLFGAADKRLFFLKRCEKYLFL